MKKLVLFAAAVLLLVPVFAQAGPMKAGKWQITMEMDAPGMPMKMPPQVVTHCVTQAEADNPEPPKGKNSDCKFEDYKIEGNVVTWKMSCPKQGVSGDGKMTFNGDSYEGISHMKVGEQEMTHKYTGKRLGDCEATK